MGLKSKTKKALIFLLKQGMPAEKAEQLANDMMNMSLKDAQELQAKLKQKQEEEKK